MFFTNVSFLTFDHLTSFYCSLLCGSSKNPLGKNWTKRTSCDFVAHSAWLSTNATMFFNIISFLTFGRLTSFYCSLLCSPVFCTVLPIPGQPEQLISLMTRTDFNRDRRGRLAPFLPHHQTCGSASGGSVKYDEARNPSASC